MARISIDPITRIEGHLRIDVEVDSMLGDFERGFGRKSLLAAVNRSDRVYQFLVNRILEQITLRSCFECPKNLYVALVGRQHDNFRIGEFSSNRHDRIEAVHLRHLQIHQRDVWTMCTKQLDRLAAV